MREIRNAFVGIVAVAAIALFASSWSAFPPAARAQELDTFRNAAEIWNGSAPGANTNILASSIAPTREGSVYGITVVLGTGSILNVVETDGAGHTFTSSLNGGVALTAGQYFTFTVGTRRFTDATKATQIKVNFQVATNGTIPLLRVDEFLGGTR